MTFGRKDMESYPRLAFRMEESRLLSFSRLLQQGVTIRCRVGCSVSAFLREELHAKDATIEKIQSIMLDGKPVDNLEAAYVSDGSTIALSAAMPGLVGATLRRGGAYASFRTAITYHEGADIRRSGEGFIRIKLFNLLMAELGPDLLQRGFFLTSKEFIGFIAGLSHDFWQGCRQVTLNSEPIDPLKLRDPAWLFHKEQVFLIVFLG